MFLSEWREFPSTPCLARGGGTWWPLASRCCWNRARPWHASELVSFLAGLRTYQHPVLMCWLTAPSICTFFFPHGAAAPSGPRLHNYTQRHTTSCRTHLDEWSARLRDLYLTTHNTHNRQTSMPPVGFENAIPTGGRPQTHDLDCARPLGSAFVLD